MNKMRYATRSFATILAAIVFAAHLVGAEPAERHLLYVAAPGIRNDLAVGGAGLLVFDMDHGHAFVKRIATLASTREKPENIKGVAACAATRRLYFTTLTKLYCVDLVTEQTLWEKTLPGGCDRLALTPNGQRLYVPSLEGPHWNVVDGATGELVTKIELNSGAHNTVCALDGRRVYLAGLKSPLLSVLDTQTQQVVGAVGPFSAPVRPFTINAAGTRCYVNVNELLGFEIGDLTTRKKLCRVEVEGFSKGPTKRHGCPSHGVGLTPDETEVWICDAHNRRVHDFDNREMPPRQIASVPLREEPGWVTFSLDGRFAYPFTGEVIDAKTKKIVTALRDELGREVHSEKMVEVVFRDALPIRNGDQFGVGRAGAPETPACTRTPDVVYGHKLGVALTLDVFTPTQHANGAAIVLVVSGGWISDNQIINSAIIKTFLVNRLASTAGESHRTPIACAIEPRTVRRRNPVHLSST
jgi:hypothetical protein